MSFIETVAFGSQAACSLAGPGVALELLNENKVAKVFAQSLQGMMTGYLSTWVLFKTMPHDFLLKHLNGFMTAGIGIMTLALTAPLIGLGAKQMFSRHEMGIERAMHGYSVVMKVVNIAAALIGFACLAPAAIVTPEMTILAPLFLYGFTIGATIYALKTNANSDRVSAN